MKPIKGMKTPNSMRPKGARNAKAKLAAEQRRIEAAERQAVRDAMTPEQQLARLDTMFGSGQGAKKERMRLATQIANPPKPRVIEGKNVVITVAGKPLDSFKPLDVAKLSKRERREAKEKLSKS